jgi:hypothetical protein
MKDAKKYKLLLFFMLSVYCSEKQVFSLKVSEGDIKPAKCFSDASHWDSLHWDCQESKSAVSAL